MWQPQIRRKIARAEKSNRTLVLPLHIYALNHSFEIFKHGLAMAGEIDSVCFASQVHVSKSSDVADHCRVYALNDPNDHDYQSQCSHGHNTCCDNCDDLTKTMDEIEAAIEMLTTDEVKEELRFVMGKAKQDIVAWKAHLLRSVNQEEARLDILNALDSTSVLLVQDWAMKFLPRKFRESQTDWFAKRGIS